jgi:phosphoribosylformylglycinamidine cyclo-ligase
MHAAVGDSQWFADTERANNLVDGFAEGCREAGAVWGGGETPALRNVVVPSSIALAGSAVGCVRPKSNRITGGVKDGDTIIFLASAGVHTNGLTLCRYIAERHAQGYGARISDGRTYGEALLAPSVVYVKFVRECQRRGLTLDYAVHVTGHGWRKLMRLEEPFVYEVTATRAPGALFDFLMEAGPISLKEAYATFNMGVGFAAYVTPAIADAVVAAAKHTGYDAWIAGTVRKEGDRKAVIVPSLGLEFGAESLQVR